MNSDAWASTAVDAATNLGTRTLPTQMSASRQSPTTQTRVSVNMTAARVSATPLTSAR